MTSSSSPSPSVAAEEMVFTVTVRNATTVFTSYLIASLAAYA